MATSLHNSSSRKGYVPEDVERFFQVSLYLLIVTSFVTLVSTGKLDSFSVMFVSVALLFRGYLVSKNRELKIPERWTSYMSVLYVGLYIADYAFLSHNDFVTASVHLVLFIIVVKMFSVHRDRDYVYLTVLAFLTVLSAAILTVDALFLGAFSFFLLVAVATFISMEMRRSAKTAANLNIAGLQHSGLLKTGYGGQNRRAGLHVSLSAAAIALVAAILLCSVVIFFMLPRLSGGYLSRLAQQNAVMSGFSDTVALGEIGRIQQSNEVVMHVRIEETAPGSSDFKLRGIALANFTGERWFNPPQDSPTLTDAFGRFDLQAANARWPREGTRFASGSHARLVRYRIATEPLGTNVVFLLPSTRYVFGRFRSIATDFGQSVYNTDRDRWTGIYSGLADAGAPTANALRAAEPVYPRDIEQLYLQIPEIDSRVAQLAREITADSPSAYDKANAIQLYLTSNYEYTLELPQERSRDRLANFLFERRKGHCEYFASSMAIMLRTVGIPSRVVTGFRGGEFNNLTGDYIVRARDAHAWVEVFFPGQGWVSFDPTPASSQPTATTWNRFLLYMDAMREFWREWVVNYDFAHQQTLGTTAVSKGRRYVDNLRDWARARYNAALELTRRASRTASQSPGRSTGYLILAIGAIGLLISLPRVLRAAKQRRIAKHPSRQPQGAASIWYHRLTRALGRRGWHKRPVQTPAEFSGSITDPKLRSSVERFTLHYERARFGRSAEDAEQLPALFDEITAKK